MVGGLSKWCRPRQEVGKFFMKDLCLTEDIRFVLFTISTDLPTDVPRVSTDRPPSLSVYLCTSDYVTLSSTFSRRTSHFTPKGFPSLGEFNPYVNRCSSQLRWNSIWTNGSLLSRSGSFTYSGERYYRVFRY